jgi:uncharacterized damage-inducible protein DinB
MQSLLVSLFKYKAWANTELFAALAGFNAHAQPEGFQAMLHLVAHVNIVDRIFQGHLSGTPPAFTATEPEGPVDFAVLSRIVHATDAWYVEFVSHADEKRLKQCIEFTFTDGQPGTMSCEEMLLHVATHGGYHRGSVGQLLEDAGAESPPDSLTKYLHRHDPGRRIHPATSTEN